MKKTLLLLVMLASAYAADAQNGFIAMGPSQFKSAVEADKNEQVIDVRQDWEFKKGHLENAVNIDVMGDDFEARVSQFSKDTPLYVYCYSGGRSTEAAEKLKALGYKKVVNLTGGYSAWEKALLPVVK